MKQLDERVVKIFDGQPIWYVATADGDQPNVAAIGFKEILPDGRILLCDVFMNQTKENLLKSGKVAISACDASRMEGYQIFGTAEYVSEGEYVDNWTETAKAMSGGRLSAKGVVLVTPEKVKVQTVGPNNDKYL